jgi:cobalt-zinc-cadmium efflux system outer membrane protein
MAITEVLDPGPPLLRELRSHHISAIISLKKIITLLAASVGACLAGPASEINEPAGPLRLRQALALALTRSPHLATVSYDIRIGEARILQAKLIPNPELEYTGENIAGSANSDLAEHTLLLGQLLELGGKRSARIREARAQRDLADFDYETKKREIFLQTAQDFVDVLALQRRVEINQQLVGVANDFVPVVVKRIEAGKASDLEKTRFDVAIGTARIELEQARHDLAAARQRLGSRWGSLKPKFSTVVGNLDATPRLASLESLARKLAANPRVARFGAEVAQREAALAREKAAAVPDVSLRAGGRKINEANDTTAVIGFSLPLPLWNRNQGNVRAARERIDRADAEQAATASELMTELTESYENVERARAAIVILRENVLPGADEALKQTGEGYEAGRFSYLDVLEARRTTGSARIQYLQALTDYHRALHTVEALTADPRPHNLPGFAK